MASDEAWMLILSAKVWGQRPSAYLGPIAPLVALAIDDALAARLLQETKRPASQQDPDVLAAGGRYEGPADWGRPLFDDAQAARSRATYRELLAAEGVKVH